MKALIFDKGVKLIEKEIPKRKENESLIKVLYGGICNTDLEVIKGYSDFKGTLGHEFVGVVVESDNTQLIDKKVVGEINLACGECEYCKSNLKKHCLNRKVLGIYAKDGCFQEYITLPDENLHIVPENIPLEEAVFVEPLAAALQILEEVHIKPDYKVILIGDGKLGLLIAQVLNLSGVDLLVLGRHEEKLKILKDKGIKTTLDNKGLKADVVIEATGNKDGLLLASKIVKPKGTIILKSTYKGEISLDFSPFVVNEIKIVGSRCGPFDASLRLLQNRLIDVKSLIHKIYPIEEGVEALEFASKKGVLKVLIKFYNNFAGGVK